MLGFISLISLIGISPGLNLFLTPFLIVGFLPLGYLYRILNTSFDGSNKLPDFDRWSQMFTDGIRILIVAIVYTIPLVIIYLISFFSHPSAISIAIISVEGFWGFLTGSIIPIMVLFIIGIIELVALANMALYGGELKAAFRFSEILKRISMIGWIKYLTFYVIICLSGLLTVFISFLAFNMVIGIIIVPLLIAPYYVIFSTRLLALTFASSESLIS